MSNCSLRQRDPLEKDEYTDTCPEKSAPAKAAEELSAEPDLALMRVKARARIAARSEAARIDAEVPAFESIFLSWRCARKRRVGTTASSSEENHDCRRTEVPAPRVPLPVAVPEPPAAARAEPGTRSPGPRSPHLGAAEVLPRATAVWWCAVVVIFTSRVGLA